LAGQKTEVNAETHATLAAAQRTLQRHYINDVSGNTPVSAAASSEAVGLEHRRKHLFDLGEKLFAAVHPRDTA
jgi:hypothetical protein